MAKPNAAAWYGKLSQSKIPDYPSTFLLAKFIDNQHFDKILPFYTPPQSGIVNRHFP